MLGTWLLRGRVVRMRGRSQWGRVRARARASGRERLPAQLFRKGRVRATDGGIARGTGAPSSLASAREGGGLEPCPASALPPGRPDAEYLPVRRGLARCCMRPLRAPLSGTRLPSRLQRPRLMHPWRVRVRHRVRRARLRLPRCHRPVRGRLQRARRVPRGPCGGSGPHPGHPERPLAAVACAGRRREVAGSAGANAQQVSLPRRLGWPHVRSGHLGVPRLPQRVQRPRLLPRRRLPLRGGLRRRRLWSRVPRGLLRSRHLLGRRHMRVRARPLGQAV